MSRRALVLLAILIAPEKASAFGWSVGAHFGFASIRSSFPYAGSSTVLAWPANTFTYQPGLRVGFGDASRVHEVFVDSGVFYLDQAGSFLSLMVGSVGYQHTFLAARSNAPFVNASVGLYREGGAARTGTSETFGGGIGMRHVVGEHHGVVRAELRVDRLGADETFDRPKLTTLGLRLGFDLWF